MTFARHPEQAKAAKRYLMICVCVCVSHQVIALSRFSATPFARHRDGQVVVVHIRSPNNEGGEGYGKETWARSMVAVGF